MGVLHFTTDHATNQFSALLGLNTVPSLIKDTTCMKIECNEKQRDLAFLGKSGVRSFDLENSETHS